MEFRELNINEIGTTRLLTGAVFQGEGETIIVFFPEESAEDDPELEVLHASVEEWQKLMRQSDLVETEVLAQAKDGKTTKAILRKCQRQIDAHVSWKVFERDGYSCRYCGKTGIPLTIDHLVLWEEGGPSTIQNLVSACKKCNKKRGNTPYGEWLKDPYYLKMTKNLPYDVVKKNLEVLRTFEDIP